MNRRQPTPHSHRSHWRGHPNLPAGWTLDGLAAHLERSDRACALLKALADPTFVRRELFDVAARRLAEANDAMRAIAAADTAEIDMRGGVPTQRQETA